MLFAPVNHYLSWQFFCRKINIPPACRIDSSKFAIIDFLCCGSVSVGRSSMHMQNVHTCLPGTSYDKTYALYAFYHTKKVNKWYARKSIYHRCSVWTEISVSRVTVWHHSVKPSDANSWPSRRKFLSIPHSYERYLKSYTTIISTHHHVHFSKFDWMTEIQDLNFQMFHEQETEPFSFCWPLKFAVNTGSITPTKWTCPDEKPCLIPYANNKGADQPAQLRSLISAIVVRYLDNLTPILSRFKNSRLNLVPVAEQASLSV